MLQVIVLNRGWVFVGDVSVSPSNYLQLIVKNAKNIRRWGTTKGLAELAEKGPTKDTVIDDYGDVEVSVLSHMFSINCNPERWAKWFPSK